MTTPASMSELSTTAASNNPSGSDAPSTIDDQIRALAAIVRQNVTKGSDIASASAITIPAPGNYFVVTGTTGITSITDTNSWYGREVTLKFSGALTITHSANLILPGAANITTVAGDVAKFVSESSGVWRCSEYTKYSAQYATLGANTFTGDQTLGTGAKLIFEGTTDNAYETTVDPGDPTADRTLTLPNKSGTLATTDERLLSKSITFTRDMTTATGTQAVTGVGFTPTAIIFLYAINGTPQEGVGFADSSKAGRNRNYLTGPGWFVGTNAITASPSSGNYQTGDVSTYDSDGFTISWAKTGAPTGTLTVYALCLR